MVSEELSSNLELITQEQQSNLNQLEVAVIGNNPLTDIVLANLAGLGVKVAYVFGKPTEQTLFDEEHYKKFNSTSDIAYIDKNFNSTSLQDWKPTALLDISNIQEEKQQAKKTSDKVSCDHITISFDPNDSTLYPLNSDSFGNSDGSQEENSFQQRAILATIAVDEIRKSKVQLTSFDNPLKRPLSVNHTQNEQTQNKILIAGAGGIGNYFCIGSRYLNQAFTLVDFDKFETKNMNRQIFCQEGRNKAQVIAEYIPTMNPVDARIDRTFLETIDKPDIVIGCVDNNQTRNLLRNYCVTNSIPYFDGGVGITQGQIMLNPPEKKEKKLQKSESSCLYKPNPSIVIPNSVIGLKLSDLIRKPVLEKYRYYFNSLTENRYTEM